MLILFFPFFFFYEKGEEKGIKKGKGNKINTFKNKLIKEQLLKMNNNIKNNTLFNIYLIIISFIQIILANLYFIDSKLSSITLKINWTGNKYILNGNNSLFERKYYPDIIYINGDNKSTINNQYNLNLTENLV